MNNKSNSYDRKILTIRFESWGGGCVASSIQFVVPRNTENWSPEKWLGYLVGNIVGEGGHYIGHELKDYYDRVDKEKLTSEND